MPTSAHIAARMIFTAANTYEDIDNCSVLDLGCGTGMLSIASSIMGSGYNLGIDIDEDALETAWINCKALEVEGIDFVQSDISRLCIGGGQSAASLILSIT